MFHNGHFTHPDLWLMWYAILMSTVTLVLEVYRLWRDW